FSSPTTIAASPAVPAKCTPPGAPLRTISTASAASFITAWSATTTSCSGTASAFQISQQGQRFSFAGAKVHVYQALDGRVSLYYGDTRLQHTLASPG
ncbi:MAG: hypothetical protein WCD47_15440, partial [Candidatus Sulfotelmatobacter sp.]